MDHQCDPNLYIGKICNKMGNKKRLQTKKLPLPLKWAWLFWLAFFLIWIRVEDVDLFFVTILGLGGAGLIIVSYATTKENVVLLKGYLIRGVIAGLFVTPLILLIILFKSSLHAHGFFEIPGKQISDVLVNTIWWIFLGPLIGYEIFRSKDADRG